MRPYRTLKIASVIQKELSNILIRDFNFDGALVTVLEVLVTDDLLKTKVKLGIIPYEKGPAVFFELQKHKREIQHKILKKMKIRAVPTLEFEIS